MPLESNATPGPTWYGHGMYLPRNAFKRVPSFELGRRESAMICSAAAQMSAATVSLADAHLAREPLSSVCALFGSGISPRASMG
jgi:hypothetical protein